MELEEAIRRLSSSLDQARSIQNAIERGEAALTENLRLVHYGSKTLDLVEQLRGMSSAVIASLLDLENFYRFLVRDILHHEFLAKI